MIIPILYQDDQLIVIDKPAGVTVNRADTVGEETVQDWVEDRSKVSRLSGYQVKELKDLKPSNLLACQPASLPTFLQRSGIVHRLDKETSGCLIIAKTPEAFVELQRQFKVREVKKEYLALVHGRVEPEQGTIRVPLARSRFDRQKFAVSPAGRQAETMYQVIQGYSFKDTPFTLLKLFPTTGRTHQIRVHLKYFGHPIVSDSKYGGKLAKSDRRWCSRLFLHAAKITFAHPNSGKSISIEAPLPADLSKSIRYFMPKVSDTFTLLNL